MRRTAVLGLALAMIGAAARADFNDGVVALMSGNYEQAVRTLMPLAEMSNHAYAQYFLGRMYADGQGVEQDFDKAASWYRKAAEQGVAEAQYRLGDLYRSGRGVPLDLEYAYAWYGVAAHLGHAKSGAAAEEAARDLAPEELEQAGRLAAELIEKYGHVPRSTSRSQ